MKSARYRGADAAGKKIGVRMTITSTKALIVTSDDFGAAPEVNEAVERAHREGILTCASLMVAAPGAGDAVKRAKTMPKLGVGLHLVLVEGKPVLPPEQIPNLVGPDGNFRTDMVKASFGMAMLPWVKKQLAAEIEAQFAAFAATGLTLLGGLLLAASRGQIHGEAVKKLRTLLTDQGVQAA